MKPNEHSKWRDFLRPLVEAAVTALAVYTTTIRMPLSVATAYIQHNTEEKTETRFVVLGLRARMNRFSLQS